MSEISILRQAPEGAWIKHHMMFLKADTAPTPCGINREGFYGITPSVQGRDIWIVGTTPGTIHEWLYARPAQQGFYNGMYEKTEDLWGHDIEAEVSGGGMERLAIVNERRKAMDRLGKKAGDLPNLWYESKDMSGKKLDPAFGEGWMRTKKTSFPRFEPGPAAIDKALWIQAKLLIVKDKQCTGMSLTPVGDAIIQLAQGAAALAPGGSASFGGELALDGAGIANDIRDAIMSYFVQAPPPRLAYMPALIVSHYHSDNSVRLGSGANNDGRVTFGEMQTKGTESGNALGHVLSALATQYANARAR
jgi:hypothetical protein